MNRMSESSVEDLTRPTCKEVNPNFEKSIKKMGQVREILPRGKSAQKEKTKTRAGGIKCSRRTAGELTKSLHDIGILRQKRKNWPKPASKTKGTWSPRKR